jgi:hypothetical protein
MQITCAPSEGKSNLPRVLPRNRHARLRHDAPRREFRAELVESPEIDGVLIDLAGGATRSLSTLIDGNDR